MKLIEKITHKVTALIIVILLTSPWISGEQRQSGFIDSTGQILKNENIHLPRVNINDHTEVFQQSIYPNYYQSHSARSDIRWLKKNDSTIIDFWNLNGDNILGLLMDFSGLEWIEDEFDIYLLRYYPKAGSADPLVLPLGGIKLGSLTEASPAGSILFLDLIYQMSHRMLAQADRSDDPFMKSVADHPLMHPGAYRRDNIATLLALVVSQQVMGLDSTFEAYQSAFWSNRSPGRRIFEERMLNEWILSPKRPLAQWVIEEPVRSKLVSLTRPPKLTRSKILSTPKQFVEGIPIKGKLGFSVRRNSANRLVVDKIDITRLTFACGLREEDVLRTVEGIRIRTHKGLISELLDGLLNGGVTLTVDRGGKKENVLIQPLDIFSEDELYDWDYESDTIELDSLVIDSILRDTPD